MFNPIFHLVAFELLWLSTGNSEVKLSRASRRRVKEATIGENIILKALYEAYELNRGHKGLKETKNIIIYLSSLPQYQKAPTS